MRWFLAPSQSNMYVASALAAILWFVGGIVVVQDGEPILLFFGMIVLSPVAMGVLRWWWEDRFERSFFNPFVMSWGFVVGDTVLLPLALLSAGIGWQDLSATLHMPVWFAVVCALMGVGAAIAFRLLDGGRYHDAGVPEALHSPTKVWHDWVVVPVAFAWLMWLLLPQVVSGGSESVRLSLMFLLLFGGTLLLDMRLKPDPAKQHPRWNSARFEVI